MGGDSDYELMTRIAAGDEKALAELIERYKGMVYGTVVKMIGDPIEAEDLAQQVFVRVFRAAGKYQATAQFKTWLFTIVRNLVWNEYRRRSRARVEPLPQEGDDQFSGGREWVDSRQKDPGRDMLDREMMEAIDRAILELPEQQRLAVILRRYDEFSYEEIAAILKTSVSSTKSLLFRARETLREKLQNYLDAEEEPS